MTDFFTVEQRIRTEWNKFYSFVALHPHWALLGAFVIGNLIGAVFNV